MNHQLETEQLRPILAAIDASPQSLAALQAAADVAALLGTELHGVFVEDIHLVQMCKLPFTCEVGSYTAVMRRLDNVGMERQLQAMAAKIRRAMEQIGQHRQIQFRFQVRRGLVVDELLAAAEDAALLSLGRTAGRRRTILGSTVQSILRASHRPILVLGEEGGLRYPFVVLYTGDEQSDRTLRMALSFAERLQNRNPNQEQNKVIVLIWRDSHNGRVAEQRETQAAQIIAEQQDSVQIKIIDEIADLLQRAHSGRGCTLFLPGNRAYLLAQHAGPTILVP